MSKTKDFRNFVYRIENIVDEFVIVALSLGAIIVSVWALFGPTQTYDPIEFGRLIFPWITMVALMIIGRELWILNRRVTSYLEHVREQGEE